MGHTIYCPYGYYPETFIWQIIVFYNIQGGDIAGPISPKSTNKTFAISRFLAKILPVLISPKFFEIFFLSVINDVILRIDSPKSSLFNSNLIAFSKVTILDIIFYAF